MPRNTVHARRHDDIDIVEPEVFGNFAANLGRSIYGVILVGEDDRAPTSDGFREDTFSFRYSGTPGTYSKELVSKGDSNDPDDL